MAGRTQPPARRPAAEHLEQRGGEPASKRPLQAALGSAERAQLAPPSRALGLGLGRHAPPPACLPLPRAGRSLQHALGARHCPSPLPAFHPPQAGPGGMEALWATPAATPLPCPAALRTRGGGSSSGSRRWACQQLRRQGLGRWRRLVPKSLPRAARRAPRRSTRRSSGCRRAWWVGGLAPLAAWPARFAGQQGTPLLSHASRQAQSGDAPPSSAYALVSAGCSILRRG